MTYGDELAVKTSTFSVLEFLRLPHSGGMGMPPGDEKWKLE
jgi:hypothetical protein